MVTGATVRVGSASPGGALPSGWLNADVGNVGRGGSATHSSGTFTLAGSGADVWGNTDGFDIRSITKSVTGTLIVARMSRRSYEPVVAWIWPPSSSSGARDQMQEYFDHRYAADNTVVALAGRLDFSLGSS